MRTWGWALIALGACSPDDEGDDRGGAATPGPVEDVRVWFRLDVDRANDEVGGRATYLVEPVTGEVFPAPAGECVDNLLPSMSDASGYGVSTNADAALGPPPDPQAWWFRQDAFGTYALDVDGLGGWAPGATYGYELWGVASGTSITGSFGFPPDFALTSPGDSFDGTQDLALAWDDPVPGAVVEVNIEWSDVDDELFCRFPDTGSAVVSAATLASGGRPDRAQVTVTRRVLVQFALDDQQGQALAEIGVVTATLEAR